MQFKCPVGMNELTLTYPHLFHTRVSSVHWGVFHISIARCGKKIHRSLKDAADFVILSAVAPRCSGAAAEGSGDNYCVAETFSWNVTLAGLLSVRGNNSCGFTRRLPPCIPSHRAFVVPVTNCRHIPLHGGLLCDHAAGSTCTVMNHWMSSQMSVFVTSVFIAAGFWCLRPSFDINSVRDRGTRLSGNEIKMTSSWYSCDECLVRFD